MMRKLLLILIFGITFWSCTENPPSQVDGETDLTIYAIWDTTSSKTDGIPLANAKVILTSEYGVKIYYTNSEGMLHLTHLPSSTYQISARANIPNQPNRMIVGNLKNVEIVSGNPVADTIFTELVSSTGISINEIYAGGPINNIFFFYDQYIEIVNCSDSIKYLDGIQIYRVSGTNDGTADPGTDWGEDGDIDGVTYAFKFPGNFGEKNYPFYPREFLVLAQTAYNHQNSVPTAVDLSHADWEFYNQLSASDFDNPNVPNLSNIRLDRTTDFFINLTSDIVIMVNGKDAFWEDGMDIETILDGVEYQSSSNSTKTLDDRIDKGFAFSPSKYSGKSMQRREASVDTDDATLDWEIIDAASPGGM